MVVVVVVVVVVLGGGGREGKAKTARQTARQTETNKDNKHKPHSVRYRGAVLEKVWKQMRAILY